ncbi:DNA polymerase I [Streptococcus dysgalactiae subsp. equisimilis]|nr:DNA polymerase I [Streptococcus dysgalactiae subsp. equisimilis]
MLYASLDKVPELPIRGAKGLPAKLEENREQAFLSYQLATIKTDVELDVQLDQLYPGEPQREALIALYRELEFKNWLDDLLREAKEAGESGEAETPIQARSTTTWCSTRPVSTPG